MKENIMDHKHEMDVTMVKEAVYGYFLSAAADARIPFDIVAILYLELDWLLEALSIPEAAEMYHEYADGGWQALWK